MRLLLVSIVVLLAPGLSVARAGSDEVQFPCRQIWTADVQRILGARAEPFQFSANDCVIKIGEKFPIAIVRYPVTGFKQRLAKMRAQPATKAVRRVQLGDEGYAIDQPPSYGYLFRLGNTMYDVMITRLIQLTPAKRFALAKAVERKIRGEPSPVVS